MSLKLCKGGSRIKFSQNNECCVPFCGATRQSNPTLPFYTLPSDADMRQEWLDLIKIENRRLDQWDKLYEYTTPVVCSKHFQLRDGGMKLIIENAHDDGTTSSPVILRGGGRRKGRLLQCDEISDETTSVDNQMTYTQTIDDQWVVFLKQKYAGIQINCDGNIQCRMCAQFSGQAISIYDECNLPLNLEYLINKFLSIQVTPLDTKPLNICVDCVFKLKQFDDFFTDCEKNDKLFDQKDPRLLNSNKNNINDIIVVSDTESEDNNCNSMINERSDRSKLTKIISNPHDFIKKVSRKLKIKILVSSKTDCAQNNDNSTANLNVKQSSSTSKVIDVEFVANYIISHGVEWIHEINVDKNQIKTFSQETVDHILEVIRSTMKKQCDIHNSKVVPLELPQSHLEGTSVLPNQVQTRTKSVIMDGKTNNNDL